MQKMWALFQNFNQGRQIHSQDRTIYLKFLALKTHKIQWIWTCTEIGYERRPLCKHVRWNLKTIRYEIITLLTGHIIYQQSNPCSLDWFARGWQDKNRDLYLPIARKSHRTHFCTIMSLQESVDTAVGHTIPDLDASISSSRCIDLGIRRISGTKVIWYK